MQNNRVDTEELIQDAIEIGMNNSLTLNNTNIWSEKDDIILPMQNVLREHYRPIIIQYCRKIKLSDKAASYYKYKPKLFCDKLYGTPDLWHFVLWLNNMTSIMEFQNKELIVLDPSYLSILTSILSKEEENIINNNENPYKAL